VKMIISDEVVQTIPYSRGAPTKYHPKMCDIVISTARSGGFKAAMCVNCGVSLCAFDKYLKEHQEFREAFEYAELITLKIQEELLVAGATGQVEGYNFKANAFVLTNKYKSLYDATGKGNTEITINTINMTSDQMQAKIAQKIEKLKAMGQILVPESEVVVVSTAEGEEGE